MASITKEITIDRQPEEVWDAVRDAGAVHERLTPSLVVATRLEGAARVCTFADGGTGRELIVDVDDNARRIVYSLVEGVLPLTHHNASMQVAPDGAGASRIVWVMDFLPDDLADRLRGLVEVVALEIQRTLSG